MKNLLTAICIVLGVIFVYGFIRGDNGDRMSMTVMEQKRITSLIVTMPDVSDRYRWLSVYGCSAEMTESGVYCTGDFERESTLELFGHQREILEWRDLPPGTLRVTAMAFDAERKVLAQTQRTVFRGR